MYQIQNLGFCIYFFQTFPVQRLFQGFTRILRAARKCVALTPFITTLAQQQDPTVAYDQRTHGITDGWLKIFHSKTL